jgi:hypothetical protein
MNPRPLPALLVGLLLSLGAAGAAAAAEPAQARIEVLFVLDSTGSMSSAIHEAKERILAIGAEIAAGEPRPDVRFGIVTFRDRGDAYVTKRWPLTRDWEATRAALATIVAEGGGDGPESVIQALHEGLRDTEWTLAPEVMKVLYLIGDAPPNVYPDDFDWRADLRWAVENGIVVQAIGCRGIDAAAEAWFRAAALASEGDYHPIHAARRVADAADAVRGVEDAPVPRAAVEGLAAVVARTARAYSGELGVRYDEAAAEPVATAGLGEVAIGGGSALVPPADPAAAGGGGSGLLGAHGRVVRDAATWRRVWAAHTSTWGASAALPAVDFHAEHVVVVSAAAGGLAGVAVARQGETLFVRPQPALDGPPVAFVRIPAHGGPVRFVEEGEAAPWTLTEVER